MLAILRDFSGDIALQQWVVDAYLITLGALAATAALLALGGVVSLVGIRNRATGARGLPHN